MDRAKVVIVVPSRWRRKDAVLYLSSKILPFCFWPMQSSPTPISQHVSVVKDDPDRCARWGSPYSLRHNQLLDKPTFTLKLELLSSVFYREQEDVLKREGLLEPCLGRLGREGFSRTICYSFIRKHFRHILDKKVLNLMTICRSF